MLRLGVQGLSAAEAGLVRALMVLLARNTDHFAWVLAHQPPYEALIVDGAVAVSDAIPPIALDAPILGVLRDDHAGPVAPGVLTRPLRQDQLAAWLTEAQLQRRSRRAALLPLGAGHTARLRLRRWPPRALIHDDPKRIRLAAMLSRRPLTLAELVTLSGVPESQCVVFLQLLQGIGVLETQRSAPPAALRLPSTLAPARSAPVPMRGWIQRLRLHLGMEA